MISKFDAMFNEIELAFKQGAVDICPDCGKITRVHPNPYYFHICEHCGWEGSYTSCSTKSVKDVVNEIFIKYTKK